jgi:hypothetical protein
MAESRSPHGTSLRVVFTEAGEDLALRTPKDGGHDPVAHLRHMFDAELIKAMREAEPHLLAWLRASRENVVAFTMDPMAALRTAVPHLDPDVLRRIAAMRGMSRGVVPDVPGMTVDRFEVDVAPEKGR